MISPSLEVMKLANQGVLYKRKLHLLISCHEVYIANPLKNNADSCHCFVAWVPPFSATDLSFLPTSSNTLLWYRWPVKVEDLPTTKHGVFPSQHLETSWNIMFFPWQHLWTILFFHSKLWLIPRVTVGERSNTPDQRGWCLAASLVA